MADSDFMVTLPSNSNMATNPSNESSDYTVKLAEPLNLQGDWEAALVSVQYTPSWLTFNKTLNLWVAYTKSGESNAEQSVVSGFVKFDQLLGKHGLTWMQVWRGLPSGMKLKIASVYPKYYESVAALGLAVCRAINDVTSADGVTIRYEYDHAGKKGYFTVDGGNMRIALENYILLGELLGHNTDWVRCDKCEGWSQAQRRDNTSHYFTLLTETSKAPVFPRVNSLWVYTNITQNQQVGDTKAPLLGIVPANTSTGQRVQYTVNPVHFLALNRSYIPEIKIQIVDDHGKRIPFAKGNTEDNVVCCIRFRRRKHVLPMMQ